MSVVSIRERPTLSTGTDTFSRPPMLPPSRKELICLVCGGSATGFNFAVITCMCCKAFFRRNALSGLPSLQCRYSTEQCEINMKTRRDCSYCRLKKCFEMGMRKELILTEDLKRAKREKILANRLMTVHMARPVTIYSPKRDSHWIEIHSTHINNISNAYDQYCRQPLVLFEKTEFEFLNQQPLKSRIKLQNYYDYYNKHEALLMQFFRRIPELRQFPDDQQLVLCKHNMRFLIRISLLETRNDDLPIWPAINLLIQSIFGKAIVEEADHQLRLFKERINNAICMRLLLVVLLFSTYPSYLGQLDTLSVYRLQAKYTELLWSYLTQRYDQLTACEKFAMMIRYCLRFQTIGHRADLKREEMQRSHLCLESRNQ